jgi:hypothetical protein
MKVAGFTTFKTGANQTGGTTGPSRAGTDRSAGADALLALHRTLRRNKFSAASDSFGRTMSSDKLSTSRPISPTELTVLFPAPFVGLAFILKGSHPRKSLLNLCS